MKILIGVPCMEQAPIEYINSMLRLKKPEGTETVHVPLCLVYVAREKIVDHAINGEFDYVMFLDSDMVFTSDLLMKLLAHDKDIITALAFQRKPPYSPCIYSKMRMGDPGEAVIEAVKHYSNGVMEIEGCGMACVLIKTEVFKKIRATGQLCYFPIRGVGEDFAFCYRAKKLGYKIYADTSLKVGHVGSVICTEDTYKAWNEVTGI